MFVFFMFINGDTVYIKKTLIINLMCIINNVLKMKNVEIYAITKV